MHAIILSTERLHWFGMIPICGTLIAVSNIGAVGAYLAATARLPLSRESTTSYHLRLGGCTPPWRTPYVALLVQSEVSAVFVFLGHTGTTVHGAYDVLVSMGSSHTSFPAPLCSRRCSHAVGGARARCVPRSREEARDDFVFVHWFCGNVIHDRAVTHPAADEPNKVLATVASPKTQLANPYTTYGPHDLWTGETKKTSGSISAVVPSHGVVLYRIRGQ